jgi:hypothetical protein
MGRSTLQWDEETGPTEVTSRIDLEARLRELARQSAALPLAVIVTRADGSSGSVGLGRAESVIVLHGAPGGRPDGMTQEWISVGQEERQGLTEFFLLGQHHSEFEDRCLVPVADAIRAIGEFFDTGTRPTWIRWEENWF